MSLKKKFACEVITITDSESDSECQGKGIQPCNAKIDSDVRPSNAKRRRLASVQSNVPSKVESFSEIATSEVVVKAEVSGKAVQCEYDEKEDVCEIVKVIPPTTSSEDVKGQEKKVTSSQKEDAIPVSSDEDEASAPYNLDESFSANQLGSKMVQDLLFREEMGEHYLISMAS